MQGKVKVVIFKSFFVLIALFLNFVFCPSGRAAVASPLEMEQNLGQRPKLLTHTRQFKGQTFDIIPVSNGKVQLVVAQACDTNAPLWVQGVSAQLSGNTLEDFLRDQGLEAKTPYVYRTSPRSNIVFFPSYPSPDPQRREPSFITTSKHSLTALLDFDTFMELIVTGQPSFQFQHGGLSYKLPLRNGLRDTLSPHISALVDHFSSLSMPAVPALLPMRSTGAAVASAASSSPKPGERTHRSASALLPAASAPRFLPEETLFSVDHIPVLKKEQGWSVVLARRNENHTHHRFISSPLHIIERGHSLEADILTMFQLGAHYRSVFSQVRNPGEICRKNVVVFNKVDQWECSSDEFELPLSYFFSACGGRGITPTETLRAGIIRTCANEIQTIADWLESITPKSPRNHTLNPFESLAGEMNIPYRFPQNIEEAARKQATKSVALDPTRIDLRKVALLTIDGPDSKDFDDAVQAEPDRDPKNPGGYIIRVAIADVSEYVEKGSLLDQEAYNRGSSVYYKGGVFPMLPEALSNGVCSLNPQEERYCMAVTMTISATGKVIKSKIDRAIMRSKARLTYQSAQEIQDGRAGALSHSPEVVTCINNLFGAYRILDEAWKERGFVKLDGLEPKEQPYKTYALIERFMVLANEEVANILSGAGYPCLYRVHPDPALPRVKSLVSQLKSLGVNVPESFSSGYPSPKDFMTILEETQAADDIDGVIENLIVGTMQKAVYTYEPGRHFGLNLDRYAHFTSPIRRYADLVVHRIVKDYLDQKTPSIDDSSVAVNCSEKEIRTAKFERQLEARERAEMLSPLVKKSLDAYVVRSLNKGLLIKLRNMKGTFVVETEDNFAPRTPISVILEKVNIQTGNIEFRPLKKAA